MGSLKRRDEKVVGSNGGTMTNNESRSNPFDGRGGGGGRKDDRRKGGKIEVSEGAKPSAKVSLFDFLEDKIKVPQVNETSSVPQQVQTTYNRPTSKPYNNNNNPSTTYKKPDENPFRKPYTKHYDDAPAYGSNRGGKQQTPPAAAIATVHSNHASSAPPIAPVSTNPNNPFTLENRSKFENNISASFASRQKRDDDPPEPRSKHYGNKSQSNSRYSSNSGGNYSTNDSKYTRDRNHQNDNRNFAGKSNSFSQSQQQQPAAAPTSYNASAYYQQNSTKFVKGGLLATDPIKASSRYDDSNFSRDDRRQPNKSHQTPPPPAVSHANINQLVKATGSMKISNNNNNAPRPASTPSATSGTYVVHKHANAMPPKSQTPHHNTQANAFEKMFPQMPNGFEYNPHKIMGFQNKETNEFALNVLKTQNFDHIPQHLNQMPPPPTARQDQYVPMQINQNYAARPPAVIPQQQQHPPPPQQHQIKTIVSSQQHFIPAVNTVINLQQFSWPLKVHDVCFAKYWEDGRVSA